MRFLPFVKFCLLPLPAVPEVGHRIEEFQGGLSQDLVPGEPLDLRYLVHILNPSPARFKSIRARSILACILAFIPLSFTRRRAFSE